MILGMSSLASVERRHFSSVRFPEVLPLIQGPLRSASLVNVWVVWIRHDGALAELIFYGGKVEDYGGRKTKSREDEATASMAGGSNSIYP